MDGIVVVLKPAGMTSHDVVRVIRRLVGQKRVGHSGTLDPGACGVLPIFLGSATRVINYMPGIKVYRAELTLGIATSSQDPAGETTEVADEISISPRQLGEAFAAFIGEIAQVPPMLSAVKVGGYRLYELARQGQEVERQPRPVRIYDLHIRKIWPEDSEILGVGSRVLFDVRCSAGTYIRTLCTDIAARLGCPAHMSFLVRTAAGPFELAEAVTLGEMMAAAETGRLTEYILPPETAVRHLPKLEVTKAVAKQVLNGNTFAAAPSASPTSSDAVVHTLSRVHEPLGRMIALARPVAGKDGYWQPERVFAQDQV